LAERLCRFSVERMSSYETGDKSLYELIVYNIVETTCRSYFEIRMYKFLRSDNATHTGECTVTACRTEFYKVRKGGDFFYGNTGNENHIEGL